MYYNNMNNETNYDKLSESLNNIAAELEFQIVKGMTDDLLIIRDKSVGQPAYYEAMDYLTELFNMPLEGQLNSMDTQELIEHKMNKLTLFNKINGFIEKHEHILRQADEERKAEEEEEDSVIDHELAHVKEILADKQEDKMHVFLTKNNDSEAVIRIVKEVNGRYPRYKDMSVEVEPEAGLRYVMHSINDNKILDLDNYIPKTEVKPINKTVNIEFNNGNLSVDTTGMDDTEHGKLERLISSFLGLPLQDDEVKALEEDKKEFAVDDDVCAKLMNAMTNIGPLIESSDAPDDVKHHMLKTFCPYKPIPISSLVKRF